MSRCTGPRGQAVDARVAVSRAPAAGELGVRPLQGWVPWHFTFEMHAKMTCRLWQDCTCRRLTRPTGTGAMGGRLTNFANASGARHLQSRTEAGFALSSKMIAA